MYIKANQDECRFQTLECKRCVAKVFINPKFAAMPCYNTIIEDGSEDIKIELFVNGRTITIQLTNQERRLLMEDDWVGLIDFEKWLSEVEGSITIEELRQLRDAYLKH